MIKKINLKKYKKNDQMHDEVFNNIYLRSNELVLQFNELHFEHDGKFSSAYLIFSDFDDINYDIKINIFKYYNRDGVTYTKGINYLIQDFLPLIKDKEIDFEVVDMVFGYEKVIILGEVSTLFRGIQKYVLEINAKTMFYKFFK